MNLTVSIPDELAARLGVADAALERRVLEGFAVEEYRAGRLSTVELQRLLGFATDAAMDVFLKARGVYEDYTMEDFRQDQADLAASLA